MTVQISHSHDRFFKELLSEHDAARDFVRYYLPSDIASIIDYRDIELVKDSFVDEALQEFFTDMLYRVRLTDGGSAYVYILFEHKSYPDAWVGLQLLRYMVKAWFFIKGKEIALPPLLPIVFYHGGEIWKFSHQFADMVKGAAVFEPFTPHFRYWLVDLSAYKDEDLQGTVLLIAGLMAMKHIMDEDLEKHIPQIFTLMRELVRETNGLAYVEALLRYILANSCTVSKEKVKEEVEKTMPEGGAEMLKTLAQQWVDEGWQLGVQEGMEEGKKEGKKEGKNEGWRTAMLEGIILGLDNRFGKEGLNLLPQVMLVEEHNVLLSIQSALYSGKGLEEIRSLYLSK